MNSSLSSSLTPPPPSLEFDSERLIEELLSLGHSQITLEIAQKITQAVHQEIVEEDYDSLSAELISELVRYQLEELKLIQSGSPRVRPKKQKTERAAKSTQPFAPHLTPLELESKIHPNPAPLQKTECLWSQEGILNFQQIFSDSKKKDSDLQPVDFIHSLSTHVARIDSMFDSEAAIEKTAIQFFNAMAGLEMIPGQSILKFQSDESSQGLAWGKTLNADELTPHFWTEATQKNSLGNFTFTLNDFSQPIRSTTINDLLLSLKLFKTTLAHQQKTPEQRVSFFIPLQADDFEEIEERAQKEKDSRLKVLRHPTEKDYQLPDLLNFLQQAEQRSFISLSFGVSHSLLSPSSSTPAVAGLTRTLRESLLVNPSLKLYFMERPEEESDVNRVPTSMSPGLLKSLEFIPSAFLNLVAMIEEEEISWDKLRRNVRLTVHFLDNLFECVSYPNEESERMSKDKRSIALGVMGWADLLYLLRVPYNSVEALELAERLAKFIQEESTIASAELAKKRGVYPRYIGSRWQQRGIPMRNENLTSLFWDPLPSNIAQVAPGIEPHQVLVAQGPEVQGRAQYLVHPFLAEVATTRGFSNEASLKKILEHQSLQPVLEIPEDIRKVFVSHQDVSAEWHLKMAQAFEKYFDGLGVAKLCPISANAKDEEILEALRLAHALDLKSIFIKRVGEIAEEKSDNKLTINPFEEEEVTQIVESQTHKALLQKSQERPERLSGSTYRYKTCCGNLLVTVNESHQKPFEILTQLERHHPTQGSQHEMVAKLISLSLQNQIHPEEILKNIQGMRCSSDLFLGQDPDVISCSEAIAKALSYHLKPVMLRYLDL
ncbi:MAG: hypothetical protein JNK65_04360 [Deltaproteobacteria bacterium]|nr:hypothetical protein [Deltaproteobacteria bacterium]